MLEEIILVFRSNAELFTIVGFLIGTLVGNYFSIERDRRKEFNEIVLPIYTSLKLQIEHSSYIPVQIDADRIEHYISWCSRRGFRNSVERYKKSKTNLGAYHPETGMYDIVESDMLENAEKLLHYLKPR